MTEPRRNLGVVFGGASVEHAISIRSARAVMAAADPHRWRVTPFAVSRSGVWLTSSESARALAALEAGGAEAISDPPTHRDSRGSGRLRPQIVETLLQCDAVFPLIHGATGEDGLLQGFLETLDLPYVGAGAAASALAMDKGRCKRILSDAGIPVATGFVVACDEWRDDPTAVARRAAQLGYPYFVKPSRGGSSIGAGKVHSREEAADAISAALACDSEALIEEAMPAPREIECGVLGSLHREPPLVSALGEIRTAREFYDYTAKYEDPATQLIAPADIEPPLAAQLRQTALNAWRAIGAEGMARADFLVGEDGRFWLGELNTIPGFTTSSMYPRMFEVDGWSLTELIDRLVELGIERRQMQRRRDRRGEGEAVQ